MTDPTLSALLSAACESPDGATVSALADRLLECDAADRVEALRRLADLASRVSRCMSAYGLTLPATNGTKRLAVNFHAPPESPSFDHERYAVADAQRRLGSSLLKAVELGHWYAFRLERREGQESPHPWERPRLVVQHRLTVSPLDGGRINDSFD